jgi:hypothetical protein
MNININTNNLINLHHKITYNDPLLYKKFGITEEKEKEDLSDLIFKYDLVSIFGLDDFLEEIIIKKMNDLYNVMIQNREIQHICSNVHDCVKTYGVFKKNNDDDNFEYFMVLFSYDNLHLFYPCICDFFDNEIISNNNLIALKNNLVNLKI